MENNEDAMQDAHLEPAEPTEPVVQDGPTPADDPSK